MSIERTVRLAVLEDAEGILRIYAPVVRDSAISFEWEIPSAAEMRNRVEKTLTAGFPWLVAEMDGEALGYAYASAFRTRAAYSWTAEVSVYVDSQHQRSGIGQELYGTLLRVLELQGYRSAYGVATAPNPSSEALHRRLGFKQVGYFPRIGYKFDAWHDVICWHISLGPQDQAPDQIRPIQEVIGGLAMNAELQRDICF